MGKSDHGQMVSRPSQRDGISGDVTPRTTLTQVEAFALGRRFLAAAGDSKAQCAFIDEWTKLSSKGQEAVAEAIEKHFISDIARHGADVMWEEVNRLLRVWSNRPWDKAPQALDLFLEWLREQQETILATNPELRAEVARFTPTDKATPVAA